MYNRHAQFYPPNHKGTAACGPIFLIIWPPASRDKGRLRHICRQCDGSSLSKRPRKIIMPATQAYNQVEKGGVFLETTGVAHRHVAVPVLQGEGDTAVVEAILSDDEPISPICAITIVDETNVEYKAFFAHSTNSARNVPLQRWEANSEVRGPVLVMAYKSETRRYGDIQTAAQVLGALHAMRRALPSIEVLEPNDWFPFGMIRNKMVLL